MRDIRVRAEALRAKASDPATVAGSTIPPRDFPGNRVAHTAYPEPASPAKFVDTGIPGGHVDNALQDFVRSSAGTYRLTLVKEKTQDGTTYRAYEQEMSDGKGGWTRAMMAGKPLLKTTADNMNALLDAGLQAFDGWNAKLAATGAGKPAAWGTKDNGLWSGTAPNGVEFSGYATLKGGRMEIITMYPEGAWILK